MRHEYVRLHVIHCEVVWFKDCLVPEIPETDNCPNLRLSPTSALPSVKSRTTTKMDTTNTKRFFDNPIIRTFLGLHNFLVLASSTILTGILSYFLHHYRYRNTHLVYQEVIAVVTLFLYLFATFLPAFKFYRGYMLPLNLLLSYFWLTSLIFSSQDYAGNRCLYNSPPFVNRCRLKHTIQAFWIIGFSYLFLNAILEALMWAGSRTNRLLHGGDIEKDRPLTSGNAVPVSNGHGTTTTV
ncbi:hypothetical protein QC763_404200 [Podospora pseudopauciseta]|uniref:MARVEL domain-containing protein n=1 Tax=Podospora pseudopauciseta TaxID=2093780 RepID=A0ABR0HET4_9PEZI|nr:hypothetical protein QC763_404200 [Podospora pseudopauciseta]